MYNNPHFISPTSYLLKKMGESNFFNPPRCKGTISNIDEYNPRNVRSSLAYNLHRVVAAVSRTAAMVAIETIVPPIGLLIHTGGLFYEKGIRPITGKEYRKAIAEQHLVSAGSELIRIAALVMVVVSTYKFSMLSHISVCSYSVACIEFYLGPVFGSRALFDSNYKEWLAKIGLQKTLGLVDVPNPVEKLKTLRVEYATTMLDCISEIQRVLPLSIRLPFGQHNTDIVVEGQRNRSRPLDDEEHILMNKTDLGKILLYLEEARNSIDGKAWNKIVSLRERLIESATILNSLTEHSYEKDFPLNQNDILAAYRPDGQVVPERPLKPLYVTPLITTLFKKVLSSNVLFPSNYTPQSIIDQKGSIRETLKGVDIITNRRKINSKIHTNLKPLRWVARMIANIGVIGIGMPVGIVYHFGQSLRYASRSIVGDPLEKFKNSELAKAHSWAIWGSCSLSLLYLPFLNGIFGINRIFNGSEREALALAAFLKNEFGVSGPNGELLNYNIMHDSLPNSFISNVYLDDLKFELSFDLLKLLKEDLFPYITRDTQKLNHSWANFELYNHTNDLIEYLNRCSENCPPQASENFQKAFELIHALKDIWQINIEIQELKTLETNSKTASIRIFASQVHKCWESSNTNSNGNSKPEIDKLLKQFKAQIRKDKQLINRSNKVSGNKVYNEFKERVLARNSTPQSIMKLENGFEQKDINSAFRKLVLVMHPDKVDQDLKSQAEALFNILKLAKEILEFDFKE